MHVAGLILGWTLLGQMTYPAAAMPDRARRDPVGAGPVVGPRRSALRPRAGRRRAVRGRADDRPGRPAAPTGGASIRPPSFDAGSDSSLPGRTDQRRAPEMVAEAMRLPGGESSGKPLALLAAVSSGADRRQQFEIVLAYWRLVQAVAEYHDCLDHARTLDSFAALGGMGMAGGTRGEDAAMLAARADAAAQTQEAQLGLLRGQYELAAVIRSPAGTPLPLPADRPHVGPYRTDFKSLFADRTPPEPVRLAERILPVQWRQVDQQATAQQAAEDALAATEDDYRRGRGGGAVVATCSRELLRQQRALMGGVCAYNRDIADYVFSVIGPAVTPQELVGRLIITADTPAARPSGGDARAVRPATPKSRSIRRPSGGRDRTSPRWRRRATSRRVRPAAARRRGRRL